MNKNTVKLIINPTINKNTIIANGATIIGVGLCLAIAQLPAAASIAIMCATAIGCGYLTNKENK